MPPNESAKPKVIQGQGKDKCPSGHLCLYADAQFNTSGDRRDILVIPPDAAANNFSEYGFDHSGDGVSAVVNNTSKDTKLFSKIDQRGDQLPIKAGAAIDDLTKYPLTGSPNGTWNDQAQSALAHNEPVPIPVIAEPQPDAHTTNRRQPVSGTAGAKVEKAEL
ncbi:peptidase inhibitor family I36 protein [Streptomyces sp. XD-27]|uniref:peptidase inhibitor family I36 protein n=1 Tax=Streptomyces sp. XD-27 TaxID=3062779 RepID=UPI0026F47300|nr:peptidase inhibitor family I36 protein [Streptomyces sp. XD-27]WKX72556.1 peptidase inhibitor family I36 protein [Streptomyces sp. XD-27]